MSNEYSFWMVWYMSCEGNRRWHMVRTPDDWDAERVRSRAEENLGGMGDEPAEILEIEEGFDDDTWIDYTEEN